MQLKDRDFILVDLETTGFNKDKHQILEVGILVIKNNKIIDNMEIQIKHKEYVLSTAALEANQINIIEHEKIAVYEDEACKTILNFLKKNLTSDFGFIVIGQNIQFDIGFLENMFLRNKLMKDYRGLVSYRNIDIMQLAILKNIEGKIELEAQNLDTILKVLKINESCIPSNITAQRHRALADCYLEYEAYIKLLNL